MSVIMTALSLAAAAIVLLRAIHVAGHVDTDSWRGHPVMYSVYSAHWALLSAGALAVALGMQAGGPMLLLGVAMLMLSDRRKQP